MTAPNDPSNVLPFPAQVLAVARAASTLPPSDPYGFVNQATAMAQAQSTFMLWTLECAAIYVEAISSHVAFAPPEALTRDILLVMLRKAASEIRMLKAPPATVEPAAPTTGGAA